MNNNLDNDATHLIENWQVIILRGSEEGRLPLDGTENGTRLLGAFILFEPVSEQLKNNVMFSGMYYLSQVLSLCKLIFKMQ